MLLVSVLMCSSICKAVEIRIYKFETRSSFSPHGVKSKKPEGKKFWYKDKDKWQSFDFSSGDARISYSGEKNFVVYKKTGEGMQDNAFVPMSSIALPVGNEVFILMQKSNSAIAFYPLSVSPDRLPKGDLVFMNMTSRVLAIKFGKNQKVLRTNKFGVFATDKETKANPLVYIAAKVAGKWEIAYKSLLTCAEAKRSIVVIYDSSKTEFPSLNVNVIQF